MWFAGTGFQGLFLQRTINKTSMYSRAKSINTMITVLLSPFVKCSRIFYYQAEVHSLCGRIHKDRSGFCLPEMVECTEWFSVHWKALESLNFSGRQVPWAPEFSQSCCSPLACTGLMSEQGCAVGHIWLCVIFHALGLGSLRWYSAVSDEKKVLFIIKYEWKNGGCVL